MKAKVIRVYPFGFIDDNLEELEKALNDGFEINCINQTIDDRGRAFNDYVLIKKQPMKAPIEHTLKFLDFWKEGNHQEMYMLLSITWRSNHTLEQFKTMLTKELPTEYRVTGVEEPVLNMSDVAISVTIGGKKRSLTGRLLKEVEPYRLSNDGEWGLNPVSLLRGLFDKPKFLKKKSKSKSKYHK